MHIQTHTIKHNYYNNNVIHHHNNFFSCHISPNVEKTSTQMLLLMLSLEHGERKTY